MKAPALRISSRRSYDELEWVGDKDDPTIELAYRESSSMTVALLWQRNSGTLKVSVSDVATDRRFEVTVEKDEALDAFYHPYAYAARGGAG